MKTPEAGAGAGGAAIASPSPTTGVAGPGLPASPPQADEANGRDRRVIGVIAFAHGVSHFCHLLLAPLFPWLKAEFGFSYAQLGLLMTAFFVVSGIGQAASGFVVDRIGALPVLLVSIALFVLAAVGLGLAGGYGGLLLFAMVAGLGNAAFHPIDFSILNARIHSSRLGKAYAAHGISGSLGWALAPVFLVGISELAGWRQALFGAAALAAIAWLVVWFNRDVLAVQPHRAAAAGPTTSDGGQFSFLRLPAVWFSFLFFLTATFALSGVQSFGPEAARSLHAVPVAWVAMCLTTYMLASAAGMIAGGWLAGDPSRAERIIAIGFGVAALAALMLAMRSWPAWMVPVMFAVMGVGAGLAGPSRDLLIKRATPPGATGRVYGTVYSGLDVGLAVGPLVFGMMMDTGHPTWVWVTIAVFQASLILSAFNIGRLTRRPAPLARA